MLYGISGSPLPSGLKYGSQISAACVHEDMPPCLIYAIAWRETLSVDGTPECPNAVTFIAGDNGHGIMQLTSSWPDDWNDPIGNITYAIDEFILPAIRYWHGLQGYSGDTLILLVAATYNEGLGAAEKYHASGDVDAGTTDEYGHAVLGFYQKLAAGLAP